MGDHIIVWWGCPLWYCMIHPWHLPMFFSSSPSAPSSWAIWYISHLNHPCAPPPAPGPDILNPKIFSRLPFLSPPPRLLHIPLPYPLLLFDDEIHLLESAVSSRELASATWQRGKQPQIRLKRPGVMTSEGMWTAGGGPRLLSYQDEKIRLWLSSQKDSCSHIL